MAGGTAAAGTAGSAAGRAAGRAGQPRPPLPAWAELVRAGVGHAAAATLLTLAGVVVVTLAGWMSAADAASSWRGAARVGVALWLSGHGDSIALGQPATEGGTGPQPLTLTPLGLTLVVAAPHVRSGLRMARLGRSWRAGRAALIAAIVAGTVTALLIAAAAAGWANGPAVVVAPGSAAAAVAVTAGLAMTVGALARHVARGLPGTSRRVATVVLRGLAVAAAAGTGWVLAASLVLTAALVAQVATVADRTGALDAGVLGGAVLVVGQVALVPTVVVWAGAVLAGPGLVVMATAADGSVATGRPVVGAVVDITGSSVTGEPPLPVFAVLGPAQTFPLWAWAGVLVVVACGGVGAALVHRWRSARTSPVLDRLVDSVVVACSLWPATAGACALASGQLAGWGPVLVDPVRVATAVAAEAGVGALVTGVALHLGTGRPLLRAVVPRPRLPRPLDPTTAGRTASPAVRPPGNPAPRRSHGDPARTPVAPAASVPRPGTSRSPAGTSR